MPDLMSTVTFGADTSELLQGLQSVDDELKQMVSSLGLLVQTSASAGAALGKMGEDGEKAHNKIIAGTRGAINAAKQANKEFESAFAPIDKAFTTMVGGLLKGTESWRKAATQAVRTLLVTELEADAKRLANRLAVNLGIVSSDDNTARGGMLAWLLSEQQKTAATDAGNTARAASDAAAVSAALAPLKAYGLGAITTEAAIAAAAAFADSASLGPPGLAAAPEAAMAAMGDVMSFTSLLSAKGGAWDLPGDTLLMAHARESVLPANVAGPMRDFFSGGSAGGAASPDVHLHVHAMDARGVRQFLLDNHAAVGEALHRAWRNGNPRLR